MVAPKVLLPWLARLAHGSGYTSKRGMLKEVRRRWHVPGFTAVAEIFCRSCVYCQHHHVGKVFEQLEGAHHIGYYEGNTVELCK